MSGIDARDRKQGKVTPAMPCQTGADACAEGLQDPSEWDKCPERVESVSLLAWPASRRLQPPCMTCICLSVRCLIGCYVPVPRYRVLPGQSDEPSSPPRHVARPQVTTRRYMYDCSWMARSQEVARCSWPPDLVFLTRGGADGVGENG